MPVHTHSREHYTVGIICALDVEKAAVEATLDEEHGRVEKAAGDDNAYTFGMIGAHNVVVACLPAGVMGKVSATVVAKDMMRSFPIKVGLMVGICGGVWSEKADVRLGDVVVSQPDGQHGGVVQWDYGKMERDGVFRRTGTLNKPPRPLLTAVQSLKARHMLKDSEVNEHLAAMYAKYPKLANKFGHQGQEHDELFEASYGHAAGSTCAECDRSRLCDRPVRTDNHPQIHYGNIASGDQVVKDGPTRDRIAREEGILCFEMEAAGLMDTFPCVVIRGVCDYADSHKNKRWQPYAAATAACYAKELLGEVDAVGVEQLGPASYQIPFSMQGLPVSDHFVQRKAEMAQLEKFFGGNDGDGDGDHRRRKVFVIHGLGGMGKTQLCVEYIRQHKDDFTAVFWLDGSSKDALRQSLAAAATRLPREAPSLGGHSALDAHDVDGSTEALLQWLSLEANTGWLLVLDNIDREWQGASGGADPQAYDFKDYLPSADHGNVLITTRLGRLQRANASLRLGEVDDNVGREMLESRAGRALPDAAPLLDKLGGLPLALVQAGAYIGATDLTVEEYIAYYDKIWAELMTYQDRYPLQEYAERSVLTTWKMSYEQARAVKPEAARLLDQWAFLHPGDVSYELVKNYRRPSKGSEEAREGELIATNKLSFQDSVGVLAQYSLVNKTEGAGDFSIHAVVHDWSLYNIVDDQAREQFAKTGPTCADGCDKARQDERGGES
ncbi:hypothetical protein MBLNU13_g11329t2 [Cladosporium sp. NU13]